ncbi:hypothetical protein Syn7502_00443 [Synechococcus sp. PCC 7502]|uniref:hypothetical protein n=1 Tax=Synechococcus sp. PCC 7502 TaxID=1173263 RepID=UPI00029F9CE8|nr:hypothetical protein [Synechococcus sp. PCC 7502]AFY72603.1 hypothetical protein Syn7502_00443 [Synechococcus sp. PCC 7502]
MHIQIPIPIQKVMRELPPVFTFAEVPPTPPPAAPEPVNIIQGAIAIISLMAVVGFVGNFINPGFIVIILLFGLGTIIWRLQIQYLTYKSRLRDHTALTENYFILLASYSRRHSEHEQKNAQTRTAEYLRVFRQPKILEVLKSTNGKIAQKALAANENTDTEISSNDSSAFAQALNHKLSKHLSKNFYRGVTIPIPGFNYIYSPEFTYIDPVSNLHLAIAIDEPNDPILKEQQKISHTYLLNSGWIVVSFNLAEVIDQPQQCLQAVTDLISELDVK